MRLRQSMSNGLEKITDKLFDLNNRYILNINKDDLNPEIPLLTDEDWKRNQNAGLNYIIFGLGMFGTSIVSVAFGIKEFVDAIYHFGDLEKMWGDAGGELTYTALAFISNALFIKSSENIEKLQEKEENKYNTPEPM